MESWKVTVLEWWGLWGIEGLGCSFAVFPVQCIGSCWSGTGSSQLSGMSDVCGRSGKCGMGCDCTSWCHGMSGDGGIHQLKGGMSCCDGWMRSAMCTSETAPVVVRMVVGL